MAQQRDAEAWTLRPTSLFISRATVERPSLTPRVLDLEIEPGAGRVTHEGRVENEFCVQPTRST